MFKHKNKKIGLVGTFIFHATLILVCIYSTLQSKITPPPLAIAVQYMPTENNYSDNEIIETKKNDLTDEKKNLYEEEIVEDVSSDVLIQSSEDTIKNKKTNIEEDSYLSDDLLDALEILKNTKSLPEIMSDQLDDTISIIETEISQNSDGYILSNKRFAISKIKPNYICNKSGTVVVRVWVNRKGETIKAEAGVRGTTESASCLLNEAKTAALKTTWTPYFDAPEVQIGKITYNFYIN